MNLVARVRKLLDDRKSLGCKNLLTQYSLALLNRIVMVKVFVLVTLTPETVDKEYYNLPRGFEGRFLSPAEVRQMSGDPSLDMPAEFIEGALAKGDRCYGIIDVTGSDQILAGYGWYSESPTVIYEPLEVTFNHEYIYMYRGFTRPAYRGRRLHAYGMALAMYALVGQGPAVGRLCRGLLSYVEAQNFISLKSVFRFGYQALGKLVLIQVSATRGHERFIYYRLGAAAAQMVALLAPLQSKVWLWCLK